LQEGGAESALTIEERQTLAKDLNRWGKIKRELTLTLIPPPQLLQLLQLLNIWVARKNHAPGESPSSLRARRLRNFC